MLGKVAASVGKAMCQGVSSVNNELLPLPYAPVFDKYKIFRSGQAVFEEQRFDAVG